MDRNNDMMLEASESGEINNLTAFKVGEKIIEPMAEGASLSIDDSGMLLFLTFTSPTAKEVESVKSGSVQFRLTDVGNMLYLLVRFEGMGWIDAPYNRGASEGVMIQRPEGAGVGYALSVYLVDANTGVLKAMRLFGLDHNFSVKMSDIIISQEPILNVQKRIEIMYGLQRKYTTKDLVGMSIASCKFDRSI